MCRALHILGAGSAKSRFVTCQAYALLSDEHMRAHWNNPTLRRRILAMTVGAIGASLILGGYQLANADQAHALMGGPLMLVGMIGIVSAFVAAVVPVEND